MKRVIYQHPQFWKPIILVHNNIKIITYSYKILYTFLPYGLNKRIYLILYRYICNKSICIIYVYIY